MGVSTVSITALATLVYLASSWVALADVLSTQQAQRAVTSGAVDLVDIRRPSEWRRSGIASGATPITMHGGFQKFLARIKARAKANGGKPIALICAGGLRSHRMRRALAKQGLSVLDVTGGMFGNRRGDPGWIASGFPVRPYSK